MFSVNINRGCVTVKLLAILEKAFLPRTYVNQFYCYQISVIKQECLKINCYRRGLCNIDYHKASTIIMVITDKCNLPIKLSV